MIPIKTDLVLGNLRIIQEKVNVSEKRNTETFVKEKLESLGIIVNRSGIIKGHPDFVCAFEGEKFYVEVKGSDGLRYLQIKWIIEHPNEIVYVYFLNQNKENDYAKKL